MPADDLEGLVEEHIQEAEMTDETLSKQNFIDVLQQLRVQQCAYSMGKQASSCDCKFHQGGEMRLGSETSNGCPELAIVISRVAEMSDDEFLRFRIGEKAYRQARALKRAAGMSSRGRR